MDDPYETLGVARSVTQDDIRKAYIKLAKMHHPDLNPGSASSEDTFKKVSAANELLSDVDKRSRFDAGEIDASGQDKAAGPSYRHHAESDEGRRYGRAGEGGGTWGSEDFDDLFGSMFNGASARSSTIRRNGIDSHYTLDADFLDAINGATRRLALPEGKMLDVKIPPGIADGQTLRLRGQGGAGFNGGDHGDALIEIHTIPHRFFERHGQDISLVLPVTIVEAALGGPVEVPTPQGPVRMRIPPHSDSGTELRLRGRGAPAYHGQPAGNLYATLRVVIGPTDAALEAFLTDWKPDHPAAPRAAMAERP